MPGARGSATRRASRRLRADFAEQRCSRGCTAQVWQEELALMSQSSAFQREVASRFGLVPNFFASAPDAPEIIERLWDFAKAGYLDNPIPSLFKERLFVYLSRFCEVRYCIVRHCAFLVGRGHSSGDPSVQVQTIDQAVRLLKRAPPWERDPDALLRGLEGLPLLEEWPAAESEAEDWLIAACTLVFVEPRRADRARRAFAKHSAATGSNT